MRSFSDSNESLEARELSLEEAREVVRSRLRDLADRWTEEGLPRPALDGKLLRPLVAFLIVPRGLRDRLDHRFWSGALALEMVHEASLLHDDILDDAPERRGRPTMAAAAGVGPALVMGDHLLTGAYRCAAATDSPDFLRIFTRSVERTVAGEIAQERSQGKVLDEAEYRRIITGKSGELFRGAFALAPSLLGFASPEAAGALGARLGCLYQMVDDFLDYCSHADRGKQPLRDYRQRKWTWPLGLIEAPGFQASEDDVLTLLFHRGSGEGSAPMERGATDLDRAFDSLIRELEGEGLETRLLADMLADWSILVRRVASEEAAAHARTSPIRQGLLEAASSLGHPSQRLAYFGRHAASFRFAARLFPRDVLHTVAGVYAFCRFTDDLVDESPGEDPLHLESRITEWLALARGAYDGGATGSALLDDVMGDMRRAGVGFQYVEELVEGVRMDLAPRRYGTMDDLRTYSYRVASVVGGWLTELFGIRDPWVLERAYALGHAMQLTNILRDVGEDLRRGRLYLPEDTMLRHGVDRALLQAVSANRGAVSPGYRALLEELMSRAEEDYERAFQGIPFLPSFFQGPVAVAANVYRGMHGEIRKNAYDNLNRRAHTSLLRKITLAARGLWKLQRAKASPAVGPGSRDRSRVGGRRPGEQEAAA